MGVLASLNRIPSPIRIALAVALGFGVLCALGWGALVIIRGTNRLLFGGPAVSGWTAAWAGDLNGDGRPDVFLSTPWEPRADTYKYGRGRIIDGRTGACIRTIEYFGGFTRLDDPDGDGCFDAVCGEWFQSNALTDRSESALCTADEDSDTYVRLAGDVDRDGCADWLSVQPFEGERGPAGRGGGRGTAAGVVRVISGRTGAVLAEIHGRPGEGLGRTSCGVGDTDGDGRDDFVLATDGDEVRRHVAILYSGASLAPIRELEFPPGEYRDGIAAAGDVDGDGSPDILLSSHGLDDSGIVRVHSGRNGSVLREIRHKSQRFGHVIGGVGDVDADGHDDFVCMG